MISVLLCSMPAEGHVRPMAAVARNLVERGWRVRFLTGRRYEPAVVATGAEFIALPAEADRLGEIEHDNTHSGIAALNAGVKEAFFDPAPAAFAGIQAALAAEHTDAVLHETTFIGAAGLLAVAPASRPVCVLCGVIPLGLSSRDAAPFGLGITPMRGPLNSVRNRFLNRIATTIILRPVHKQADEVLRRLGAPALDGRYFMDLMVHDDIVAQFTVEEFEYPRSDAPPSLQFFGPVTRLNPSQSALPGWWEQLDGSRPVVHVSQGTIANADFDELITPTLRALADDDVTVVVSTGGRPLDDLPPLPANALAAPFIPYDRLLEKTDLFITNGGYGGLHFAMQYGTPIIVAGETEDKIETSARVAWSGVGIRLKTGRPSPKAIARAVHAIRDDPRYARRSAEIGAAIRASRGVDGLAEELERLIAERGRSA